MPKFKHSSFQNLVEVAYFLDCLVQRGAVNIRDSAIISRVQRCLDMIAINYTMEQTESGAMCFKIERGENNAV